MFGYLNVEKERLTQGEYGFSLRRLFVCKTVVEQFLAPDKQLRH